MGKHRRYLERPNDTLTGNSGRLQGGDVFTVVEDLASGRAQEFGQQVKDRGLARAIGPDQCMDITLPDLQVDVINRYKSFEFLDQVTGLENVLFTHEPLHL